MMNSTHKIKDSGKFKGIISEAICSMCIRRHWSSAVWGGSAEQLC